MADLRLLRGLIGAALLLPGLAGCTREPFWAARLEGRVVDKRTGKPVPGVEVFALYQQSNLGLASWRVISERYATTDQTGHFVIPEEPTDVDTWLERYALAERPLLILVHRDYGYDRQSGPTPPQPTRDLLLEIDPDEFALQARSDPRKYDRICRHLSPRACDRACEVVYGSADVCYEKGGRKRW